MSEPIQLYSSGEIAALLGESRHWMIEHASRRGSPIPPYCRKHGTGMQYLWTTNGVLQWRAYHAGEDSLPSRVLTNGYSDHNAVNRVANTVVTWKLWWQITGDGPVWWFSTPGSWWTSVDDGRSWTDTESMVRPSGFRYCCVKGIVTPNGAMAAILRSAAGLRRRLEAS